MTAIERRIAISGPMMFKPRMIDHTAMTEDELAVLRDVDQRSAPLSADERQAAVARQNAVEAHTVYRLGGKILGVQWRDGVTTFTATATDDSTATDGGASALAKEKAAARGLTGAAANDFIAEEIAAGLQERYGAAVQAETYVSGAGPTRSELQSEMFGHGSASAVGAARSRVAVDTSTFALLQEAG